ncbi:MAG: hypothetical protein WCW78_02730 [Candidatus Paceibacterota bacterium]|jgi:hypothetical protein
MALKGKIEKKSEGGKEVDLFVLEFTNGTLEQLRELSAFLKGEGFEFSEEEEEKLKEVVRIGIAWLQKLKENKLKEESGSQIK